MEPSILNAVKRLRDSQVEFIVVGGVAGVLQGAGLTTADLDVWSPMTAANFERIVAALRDLHPVFRFSPRRPPFPTDAAALVGFKNLNLDTDLGPIDLLGEVSGAGNYEDAAREAIQIDIGGGLIKVLDLERLIRAKRAANRPKDRQWIWDLEAIRREKKNG